MKMKGGFTGITGNEQAMEEYFIIAPTLSRIVQEFKEYAGIESRKASSLHYKTDDHKKSRMIVNATKLARAINVQGSSLLKDMHILVTFAVASVSVISDTENQGQLGREALEKLTETGMVSNTTEFW